MEYRKAPRTIKEYTIMAKVFVSTNPMTNQDELNQLFNPTESEVK